MTGALFGLEPSAVWKHFGALLSIPRPSGSECAAADYIVGVAKGLGLDWKRDGVSNVLVRRPGTGSGVVLQAHTDIVADRLPGCPADPAVDGVTPELRDGWVTAVGTTLGADNGMGVAIMLAMLESPLSTLPPLECLFTVDEERGLLGARVFPPEWLAHRRLINLDSEEENSICIGCAGGRDVIVTKALEWESGAVPVSRLTVGGLAGGHSGMEINRGRANAISVAARVCRQLGLRVAGFSGGSKHNAIPRDAQVLVAGEVPPAALLEIAEEIGGEFAGIEKGIVISAIPSSPRAVLTGSCSTGLLDLLLALPHGVAAMSGSIPGLVQTSCNLAIARTDEKTAEVTISVRSSIDSSRDALVERIISTARLSGCSHEACEGYPGWTPDPDSPLLAHAEKACREYYGSDPEVVAIHAGLECGIIGKRVGGMDMISMGPDIRDVHIPGERVRISSVQAFMGMLVNLLESLA
ncbi:MAG: beta-Ala-His dipeptidase [Candidatus Fermentibacteraceae bacterium]